MANLTKKRQPTSLPWILWGCGLIFCAASASLALQDSDVLIIYNADSAEGAQIASHYTQVHPGVTTLALDNVPLTEQVDWDVYLDVIRPQVLAALDDSIDCIATTRGLPLRISNPETGSYASWNRYSSLESELARIDTINSRELMGNQAFYMPAMFGGNPLGLNPYAYNEGPFDHQTYGTRLTARLDGFSAAEVNAAVTRAQKLVLGRPGFGFLVDDDPNAPGSSADTMENLVNTVLPDAGVDFTHDDTDAFVTQAPGAVQGYTSHGRHGGAPEGYILDEENGLTFDLAPGAAFYTYESFNAYSFQEGGNRAGQGLIAEWIRRGGSAGVGFVEEPGVGDDNLTTVDSLFGRLLQGYSWAEAAWNTTTQLSFVNTVVGDPLMTYKPWVQGDADLDGDVDMMDITAVKASYGKAAGQAGYNLMADMNADGLVDLWDLTFVKFNYTGPNGSNPPEPGGSIPEPATLLIIALGAAAIIGRRRTAHLITHLPV